MNFHSVTSPNDAAYDQTHDTCPLCFRRYLLSQERVCHSCDAHSCPDCVERSGSGAVRCYACPRPRESYAA